MEAQTLSMAMGLVAAILGGAVQVRPWDTVRGDQGWFALVPLLSSL